MRRALLSQAIDGRLGIVRAHADLPEEIKTRYAQNSSKTDLVESTEFSLVKSIEGKFPGTAYGHVLDIPHFGKVYLAVVRIEHRDPEGGNDIHKETLIDLTMLDIRMGCIASGHVTCGTGKTNGSSTGGGTLTLSAASAYTGNTTVQGGNLVLNYATLASNSTVSVASGATLTLNFTGTDTVTNFVLNGVNQGPGFYYSSNSAPYLSGPGSLLVRFNSAGTFTNHTGITGFSLNGANIVLNATNGQKGDAYYLLSSTNLALPLSQWTVAATNVLGNSGNYTFTGTNVLIPGAHQQFFQLSNTNF